MNFIANLDCVCSLILTFAGSKHLTGDELPSNRPWSMQNLVLVLVLVLAFNSLK